MSNLPKTITAEPSPAYKRQLYEWNMINALLGGTGEIRKAKELYLPRHQNENQSNYEIRLSKATLAPLFKRAVSLSTSKAFYKPARIETVDGEEPINPKIKEIIEDADKKNNSFSRFCNIAFKDSWAKGLGYIYVEAPYVPVTSRLSVSQTSAFGMRPYLLYIPPEDVLDCIMDESGRIVFAKILEHSVQYDETTYSTIEITQVRLVTPHYIGIYTQPASDDANVSQNEATEYILELELPNNLGMVPLVPFYAGERKGDFEAASSFIDLAYTNIQYYQDESTHENAISFAEFPILVLTGGEGSDITIGANKLIVIKDPSANLKYVEHSGASLDAGRRNLEDLRVKSGYCGLKVMMSDTANRSGSRVTATEAEIENIESSSELKLATDNFVDSINMALWYCERYMGLTKEDEPNKHRARLEGIFSISKTDIASLAYLMDMTNTGRMRLETFYNELKRRGSVDDNLDVESELVFAQEHAETPESYGTSTVTTRHSTTPSRYTIGKLK